MDKLTWHHWCTASRHRPPKAWTTSILRHASPQDLEKYAREVGFYLRAEPVTSPLHAKLADDISASIEQIQHEPPGARSILAISGSFASGKSTLVKEVAKDLYLRTNPQLGADLPRWMSPREPAVESEFVPVVYVNLQSDTATKDLYAQILTYFDRHVQGSKTTLAAHATKATKLHGVKLLILDDAHMLRTHLVTGRATLDTIKVLGTELGEENGQIVLVGAWDAHSDLLDDPQIRSRLKMHTVKPYGINSETERANWQKLLYEWEKRLQLFLPELPNGTLKNQLAGVLFQITQGYAGDLASCLSAATRASLLNRSPTLDLDFVDNPEVSRRALDHIAKTKKTRTLRSTG